MKSFLIVNIIVLCSINLIAQPGFIKLFRDIGTIRFDDILIDNDTIVGYMTKIDTDKKEYGFLFVKIDTLGNILSKRFVYDDKYWLSKDHFSYYRKIIKTKDGGYALGGSKSGAKSSFFIKLYHNLDVEFMTYYPSHTEYYTEIIAPVEKDNGFLILGVEVIDDYVDNYKEQQYVIGTDKHGKIQWRYNIDEKSSFQTIKKIDNNEFVLSGEIRGNDNSISFWRKSKLLALDSLGNVLWEWTSEKDEGYKIYDFLHLDDGSWICTSLIDKWEEEEKSFTFQPIIFKLDQNFNILWEKKVGKYAVGDPSVMLTLKRLQDQNIIVSGLNLSTVSHVKFTIDGEILWERNDFLSDVLFEKSEAWGTAILESGSIFSCGTYKNFTNGTSDIGQFAFLMKMTSEGCIDNTKCQDWVSTDNVNIEYGSPSVFPNPAHDWITFSKGDLAIQKQIDVLVYDIYGHEVANMHIAAFEKEVNWNLNHLPKGLYFTQMLIEGEIIITEKLIVQ